MADDWFYEEYENKSRFGLKVTERIFEGRSDFQKVEVFDTELFGRALAIDDIFMTSEGDESFYHEMLVHPALVSAPTIGRVLVIGGGDGGTVREVMRHRDVQYVRMVEIDSLVVEMSQKYLRSIGSAWDDPRLELTIGDGIAYVRESTDEQYDVVLLDGTDPIGPAEGLFNEDFYRGVRRMLKPGGVFALQSESPVMMQTIFQDIQHTLARVFPKVAPYFGPVPIYAAGTWSWTYATDTTEHGAIVPQRADAIEQDCLVYNRELHRAAFAQPNYVRKLLSSVRAPTS